MDFIKREFVSEDKRNFPFKMGRSIASSLSGFIAGVVLATIVWVIATAAYLQSMGIE